MGGCIHSKVQLAPDSAFLLAMLTPFPLAFTVNLELGGIDDLVFHWPLVRRSVVDSIRLGPRRLLMRL